MSLPPQQPRQRIAVIGAGVSGLVAAHLLCRAHDVTVFEAGDYAGGHTNTVRVDTAEETHWVDTGFIVYNDRNYPNFERLLDRLGVETQPSSMSFSVADPAGDFEYNSRTPNGLYAKRSHLVTPWFQRMLGDVVRFGREGRALLELNGTGPGNGSVDGSRRREPSLREWLDYGGFSQPFVEKLIVPQAAAVWSADPDRMWDFPARFLVEFFDNHGMFEIRGRPKWRTISGGSRRYVEELTRRLGDRLRLSTPIDVVSRDEGGVAVKPAGAEAERFDHVVFATHSDQALELLAEPTRAEREVLGAIPFQANEAVLHSDPSLLPRRRRAWASWNYHLLPEPGGRSTVTYHMNRLQSLQADREFCVTLNRSEAVDPAAEIRTISYAHPVFTVGGVAARKRHGEISGAGNTHYCGAYWGSGFHEDGVVSALRVSERFGVGGI
jgi:predicted NAD/FAD-binding protein